MDNGSGGRLRGRVGQHDLVGRELGAAVQEVAVILVVEHLGCDLIQVLQCIVGLPRCAVLLRELALHLSECVRSWRRNELLNSSACKQ